MNMNIAPIQLLLPMVCFYAVSADDLMRLNFTKCWTQKDTNQTLETSHLRDYIRWQPVQLLCDRDFRATCCDSACLTAKMQTDPVTLYAASKDIHHSPLVTPQPL